ncbi:MAG: hypothetical protein HY906_04020 [Deltaproteobacteria bacterium]|nr:hypothetical protein [Deltaproteobacteria bacterium]
MTAADGNAAPPTWWHPMTRRQFAAGGVGLAAAAALAGVGAGTAGCSSDEESEEDSLALQRKHGWAIGQETRPLVLPGTTGVDSRGGTDWRRYHTPSALLAALTPNSAEWRPFFVPTLIQSLGQATLKARVMPVFTPEMQEACARGEAIGRDLLAATESPRSTLVVADLPGRQSVALAAGLAGAAHVVPTFDNWPHPLGVVPAGETLGALLYYAADLDARKGGVAATAPAVFALDANRLAPYNDPDTQFDNRYPARLPDVATLKSRGVRAVLYVVRDRTVERELDDLNDLFVAYRQAGIQVALLPAVDLQRSITPAGVRYYYGGYPHTHFYFFAYHPYFGYRPALVARTRVAFVGTPRAPAFGRLGYSPVARPTAFSGHRLGGAPGVGRARPSGFGRTSVRSSGGRITGVRAGGSGSFRGGGFFG